MSKELDHASLIVSNGLVFADNVIFKEIRVTQVCNFLNGVFKCMCFSLYAENNPGMEFTVYSGRKMEASGNNSTFSFLLSLFWETPWQIICRGVTYPVLK